MDVHRWQGARAQVERNSWPKASSWPRYHRPIGWHIYIHIILPTLFTGTQLKVFVLFFSGTQDGATAVGDWATKNDPLVEYCVSLSFSSGYVAAPLRPSQQIPSEQGKGAGWPGPMNQAGWIALMAPSLSSMYVGRYKIGMVVILNLWMTPTRHEITHNMI